MIDSIGSSSGYLSANRANAALETGRLRSTQTLTAIQQTSQKDSSATAPVRVFAVPQAGKSGEAGTATSKLPRGSLVDVLV